MVACKEKGVAKRAKPFDVDAFMGELLNKENHLATTG